MPPRSRGAGAVAAIGALAATTTVLVHYGLMFAGRQAAFDGTLGAWWPDLRVAVAAIAIELTVSREPAKERRTFHQAWRCYAHVEAVAAHSTPRAGS